MTDTLREGGVGSFLKSLPFYFGNIKHRLMTSFGTSLASAQNGFKAGRKAAKNALDQLNDVDDELCLVFVFSSDEYEHEDVLEGVREVTGDTELIGCSTAGEFTEDQQGHGNVAVGVLSSDELEVSSSIRGNLSDDMESTIKDAATELEPTENPNKTVLNLHSAMAGNGEKIVATTLGEVGVSTSLAGASAGDDYEMEETFVYRNGEAVSNAVVLASVGSDDPMAISVDHGHDSISDDLEITKAEGNKILEIDNRPAYDVWKDAVEDYAKDDMGAGVDKLEDGSEELVYAFSRYELGLKTSDDDYKVRWLGLEPTTEGHLTIATEVSEGQIIRIMRATKESEIESPREGARRARQKADTDIAGALVFDCSCHSMILGDEFGKATQAIADELDCPIIGFESYGEVGVADGEISGFHNTTSVIVLIPE